MKIRENKRTNTKSSLLPVRSYLFICLAASLRSGAKKPPSRPMERKALVEPKYALFCTCLSIVHTHALAQDTLVWSLILPCHARREQTGGQRGKELRDLKAWIDPISLCCNHPSLLKRRLCLLV